MTDREELIDGAARAMYAMTNELSMSGARDLARTALAVFEKAHTPTTPTDDEQEALIAAAREKAEWRWPIPINYLEGDAEHTMLVALRHAYVLGVSDAADLRRSEVPEPSDTERIARSIAESSAWNFSQAMALVLAVDALTPEEATQTLSPEPQGEPSDDNIRLATLAAVRKGARSDAEAVRNYREAERVIRAAIPHLRRRVSPEPAAPERITIQHTDGNSVTGTPEQVLNHGHLKPGWSYRAPEPQGEPTCEHGSPLSALCDYAARYASGETDDAEPEHAKPQGEPSDAAVQAALDAWYASGHLRAAKGMRAALRAAAAAEEGENHGA